MKSNKFDMFLKNRQNLIDQYNKGDLTKDEFINENFHWVRSLGIKPFKRIDNMKKAIFNYQYYNVMAKFYQRKAHLVNKNYFETREDYMVLSNEYYEKKDRTTLSILKLLDFRGIKAYYVKVKSPNLKRKLFEIIIEDDESIILHSKNEQILALLIAENVFTNEVKKSLTDDYINQKY